MPFNGCQLRLRTLSREVAAGDLSFAIGLKLGRIVVGANRDVVQAGEVGGPIHIIQHGWAFRYRRWPDGRRQILDFLLPGDVIGLESGLLGMCEHSVRALTELELCHIGGQRLDEIFHEHARLALALAKYQSLETRRMDAWCAVIGRRTALERLAYLMMELAERQRLPSDGEVRRCAFPLRRQHMADATGLTGAHINRTLNALRRDAVATVADAELVIHDRAKLVRLAGWDSGILAPAVHT